MSEALLCAACRVKVSLYFFQCVHLVLRGPGDRPTPKPKDACPLISFLFQYTFSDASIHLTLHHDLLRRPRGEQVKTALAFRVLERAQGQIEPVL